MVSVLLKILGSVLPFDNRCVRNAIDFGLSLVH